MIWGAFQNNRKLRLAFINGRMGSEMYQEVLEAVLIPFLEDFDDENLVFQQNGAPAHRSLSTRNWLHNRNIDTMVWPANSPDINPTKMSGE